ncbi:unnamed protein product, partial [Rotaria magnacalcarata]
QIRYRLNHLNILHQQFELESNIDIDYVTFTRYIPSYIKKPNNDSWGTCLCMPCLNPQLKYEKLHQLKRKHARIKVIVDFTPIDLYDLAKDEIKINEFKDNLTKLDKEDEEILVTFCEWQKIKAPHCTAPVSTKISISISMKEFIKKFIIEVDDISTELSDPIFDIMDENDDELEYTTDELNRYYLEDSYLYPWIDNEETIENDLIYDFNDDLPLQEEEQEVLSQRLSQLSTNHDNDEPTTATMNKRPRLSMTTIDENENENEIPKYLLLINPLFVRMIRNFIDTTSSSLEIAELQKIAVYMHHIKTLQLQKQISMTYLLLGTGQLGSSEFELVRVDRGVWSIQVKNVLIEQQKNLSSITTMEINHDQDDHATCEALVRQGLKERNEKIDYYQKKCDEIKNHFMETNSNIEIAIEHYVQQYGIQVVQLKSNLK